MLPWLDRWNVCRTVCIRFDFSFPTQYDTLISCGMPVRHTMNVVVWNYVCIICNRIAPLVLWRCWMGDRKGIRLVKNPSSMKKTLRETQTLRAGCSKAEPKIFAPPLPGAQDGQNLISWRWSLPLPTNSVWWRSMHAISSYRGNRRPQTHPLTHAAHLPQTGPITIHCATKLRAQCNNPQSFSSAA